MKKLLITFVFFLPATLSSVAQHDKQMIERLDSVLIYTQQANYEALMNLTYPGLFKLVPKEKLVETLKAALYTEDYEASVDSVKLTKIFPAFVVDNGTYVKISHSMLMLMKIKEPFDTANQKDLDLMIASMEEGMGKGNVRFDKPTNTFKIIMMATLIGVKNEQSPQWTFANLDEDSPVAELIFSKDVLAKLKELQ